MAINPLTSLASYVKSLGTAYVYVGDFEVAGNLGILGATEGEIRVEEGFQENNLTAPEWTGEAVHESNIDGAAMSITVPLIMGDEDLYDKISPVGQAGQGYSRPQPVATFGLFIVPRNEVPDGGLSYDDDTSTWTPAAPKHCVIITRAMVIPGPYAFRHADGGKVIREVTFRAMFDDTRPEGYKLYTIGAPAAAMEGLYI